MIRLEMPWPPATNHLYPTMVIKGKPIRFLGKEGKAYHKAVSLLALEESWPALGEARLAVGLIFRGPSKRSYDLDGRIKCLIDSLEKAGLYDDDKQIDYYTHIIRWPAYPPSGIVYVEVRKIEDDEIEAWLK